MMPFACMELQWNTQSLDITKKQSHGLLGQLKPILHIVTRGTTRHGAKILQAMGCQGVQGFHYTRALPLDDLRAWEAKRLEDPAMGPAQPPIQAPGETELP